MSHKVYISAGCMNCGRTLMQEEIEVGRCNYCDIMNDLKEQDNMNIKGSVFKWFLLFGFTCFIMILIGLYNIIEFIINLIL